MILLFLACSQKNESSKSTIEDTSQDIPQCMETGKETCQKMLNGLSWMAIQRYFHLGSENALTNAYQGNYGVYDLNTVAFEGGNGFLLERPGRVVGAEVQWKEFVGRKKSR